MPHQVKARLRFWNEVDFLPGYLVCKHKSEIATAQKDLLTIQNNINKKLPLEQRIHYPIIETKRFTLIKKEHADSLAKLDKKAKLLQSSLSFDDEVLAKLAYDLDTKGTNRADIKASMREIKAEPLYQKRTKNLLEKYTWEELDPKKRKKGMSSRKFPKPFRYFGNSMNYMENILILLENSEAFKNAKTIRDITCGSCIITLYLAQKYPDKKFIASDINGELINALNYIKNTPAETIREAYSAYEARMQKIFLQKLTPDAGKELLNAEYKKLMDEFNKASPDKKDYCLFIFLQNNTFTNLVFDAKGISGAYKLTRKPKKQLKQLLEAKEIINQEQIEFKTLDMLDATREAKEGDFYFLTPPHEHDAPLLYMTFIEKDSLVQSLIGMSQKNIPYLVTYGDNTTFAATDISKKMLLHKHSYIAPGGIEKNPKKFIIFTAPNVVNAKDLQSVKEYFINLATKKKTTAKKKLLMLESLLSDQQISQEVKIRIKEEITTEEFACDLAGEILNDYGLTPDVQEVPFGDLLVSQKVTPSQSEAHLKRKIEGDEFDETAKRRHLTTEQMPSNDNNPEQYSIDGLNPINTQIYLHSMKATQQELMQICQDTLFNPFNTGNNAPNAVENTTPPLAVETNLASRGFFGRQKKIQALEKVGQKINSASAELMQSLLVLQTLVSEFQAIAHLPDNLFESNSDVSNPRIP